VFTFKPEDHRVRNMDDEWLAMGGLTVAVLLGLGVLIAGVLQDPEHLHPLTATGSGILVLGIMGMAGYLNRL
jgi:hypothetical protein